MGLKNKFALITGGSRGIGRSTALALAGEGCNVAICARNKEMVEKTVKEIEERGVRSLGISADVMIAGDIDRAVKTIIDSWGTIHILINNAGGGGRWGSESVTETPEDVWLDVYNKNALAAIRFTVRAIGYMEKQSWGRVVTVSSIYGKEGGGRPWFSMAKSAEVSLMKSLSMNRGLIRHGITFNTVAPGRIIIPGTGWEKEQIENPEKFNERMDVQFPLGRLGKPEEVADVITFLCSEKASLINGSCVVVDGGESRSF